MLVYKIDIIVVLVGSCGKVDKPNIYIFLPEKQRTYLSRKTVDKMYFYCGTKCGRIVDLWNI